MPNASPTTAPINAAARFATGRQRDPGVLAEVLALPAEHLTGLPLETRLFLQGHGFTHEIVWTTQPAARSNGDRLVFSASEIDALVVGVQSERLWSSDLKGFCLHKLHDPSFEVTAAIALGGAQPDASGSWSLGQVLRRLDLELVAIEVGDAPAGAASATSVAA